MESNTASSPATPAAYGRACTTCARAKAKCILNNSRGGKCERCHRLNKDCQLSTAIRRRQNNKRKPTTKVDRLEEKLDGLVTLIQSNTQPVAARNSDTSPPPSHNHLTPDSMQSLTTSYDQSREDQNAEMRTTSTQLDSNDPQDGNRILRNSSSGGTNNSFARVIDPDTSYTASGTRSATHHSPSLPSRGLEPSPEEAEDNLNLYKTQMMPSLPITIVSASISARRLYQDRPFLWLCIMAISTKSTEQQKALGREIRLSIGREMILEGKNNLDLLSGLITYTAWAHFHIYDKVIITTLMQLAIGLVASLGLRKLPPKEPPQMMLDFDARGCPKPFNPCSRTLEERRVVVGCFLVSSMVASYFQRLESLRWTPYLEECLQVLTDTMEYSSDALLVQLVRSQLIVERVGQAPWHDANLDATTSVKAPTQFYLKALLAQLQELKHRMPPQLLHNKVVRLHTYSAELFVHEIGLSKSAYFANELTFQRLDYLYASLDAIKNWFNVFLALKPAEYFGASMAVYTQLAHCTIALYRLSTFENPDWDLGFVRQTSNLSLILDQVVRKMTLVKGAMGLDVRTLEDKDIFSVNSRTMNGLKTWWDSKLAAENTLEPAQRDETMGEVPIDFLDDAWLQDLFGTGQYGFEPFPQ